jgi:hypothetical protein
MERMGAVRQQIVAGNAGRALQMLDSLQPHVPDHPNLLFLRAHALGKAGRMSEAAEAIRSLQRRDPRYAQLALRDSSVIALRPDFPAIDSLAAAASRPFTSATVWATIAERDLIAEGTAYDPATNSVLVGSLNMYKVVAIGPDGSVADRMVGGAGDVVTDADGTVYVTDSRSGRVFRRRSRDTTLQHFAARSDDLSQRHHDLVRRARPLRHRC